MSRKRPDAVVVDGIVSADSPTGAATGTGATEKASPWWRRPGPRIAALTVLMAMVSVAAVAGRVAVPQTLPQIGWLVALIGAFAATEGFVVHVRVRRGAHAVGLGDVPMVLGFLAIDPFLVIIARVIGGGGSLRLVRHQRGAKLAFNTALIALQGTVGALTFRLCGGTSGTPGPREWLAAYAATLLADVTAVVAVTAVIALTDDPGELRRLPAAMRTVPLSAVATTVALISALAAQGNHWVLVLLGMLVVAVHVAYQAFVHQQQGKAEIEQLYAFTRALNGAAKFDDVLPVLLGQVRDQLRAEVAELVVPTGAGPIRYRIVGADRVDEIRGSAPDDAWLEQAIAGRPTVHDRLDTADAMAVPVAIGETSAALAVLDPLPDSGAFNEPRLHLLEALANHAGVALTKVDLVERLLREAAEKEHLAQHDALSGLPNRRHFHTLLGSAVEQAAARGTSVAVLIMDINQFAEVNDALGHDTGDALLIEVAHRLQANVAGRGVAARVGGDEFAVLTAVPSATDEDAAAQAEALLATVERAMHHGPLTLHVRASVGVALAPRHGTDPHTLVRHADVAMYAAKQHRAGVLVYHPGLDRNTPKRLALAADLRAAIDRQEVQVAYQPKLEAATGTVVGAEALARWHHPEHGHVPPDQFIPLAEHSGLIRPLTMQILTTALRSRAGWARSGHDIHVAVNLSPSSLSDAGLPDAVARLLDETGTPPSRLTLEITESTLMDDADGALATLNSLQRLGVALSIDDFGTGYSSLSRLRTLPMHEIKIDRSFVQRLAADRRDQALVRSAIQMGHALDLSVVAEGVEDGATMAFLAAAGCDLAQGYHISRPLAADGFAAWLQDHGHRTPRPPVPAGVDSGS